MRFFWNKPKNSSKPATRDTQSVTGDRQISTPIHEQHVICTKQPAVNVPVLYPSSHLRDNVQQSTLDDQPWEGISNSDDAAHARALAPSRASTLPSRTSPPLYNPSLPRPPSLYTLGNNKNAPTTDRESPQVLRRKPPDTPVTLGILRSLARQAEVYISQPSQTQSEERPHSSNDRLWDKEAMENKEFTLMIDYLIATASENWALVLEVCERASSTETSAKEAVCALRKEFTYYYQPAAQLSAVRLWAIMSQNCTGAFIAETSSRKFISTLEGLITSYETSPVVRERVLDVVAAAAYNGPKDSGFRNLWRRFRPADKPEEGIPFDLDDEMINPPTANLRRSQIEINGSPVTHSIPVPLNALNMTARERIISLKENIRRLFQECHIGMGNAALLSDALVACIPEELKTDPVIKELIDSQIPWVTVGAEHSRSQSRSSQALRSINDSHVGDEEQTTEEQLLGELKANEELQFLKQHSDLERVAFQREGLTRKKTWMEPQHLDGSRSSGYSQSIDETPSSRSPSPSIRSETPARNSHHHDRSQTSLDIQNQLLPPLPASHGPRSPQPSLTSRSSPGIAIHDQRQIDSHAAQVPEVQSTTSSVRLVDSYIQPFPTTGDAHESDGENVDLTPMRPSAKALWKRRLVESVATNFDLDELSDLESLLCISDMLDSGPDEEVQRVGIEDPFLRPVQQEYVFQQSCGAKDAHASYFTSPTLSFPIPDNGRSYPGQYLIPPTPSTSQSIPYLDHGSPSSTPTTPLSFQPQSSISESVLDTHVAPLTYQDQLILWKEARNLPAAGGNPVFILQRIYKPHTTSDIKRYVEEASFDSPIFFWVEGPKECGISLTDSLHGRTERLRDRDTEVFEGRGPSVSIRLEWPGYRQWSRQIPTKDFKSPPRPISMTKLCKNVAKCVQRFILERQHCELEEGTDPRWKVGDSGIRFEDLVLVSLHHVSMGSWQPQLRFRKRMK